MNPVSDTLRPSLPARSRHVGAGQVRLVAVDELQRAWHAVQAGEFRGRSPARGTSPSSVVDAGAESGRIWTPQPEELVVPLLGCSGQDGATTLAMAIACAAGVPARVVECAPAPLSGLAAASDAELGVDAAGWQRGRRGSVVLERRPPAPNQSDLPMPNPAADSPSVTIIDAGPVWTAIQGHGWVPSLVESASRVVLVSRLSVPGLRRLEASLGLLGEQRVVAAVVGPPARRWPRSVACTLGPLTRALIGAERLVSVPDDRRLALFGVTSTGLPRPVLAAGKELLALMEGIG